MGLWVQEDRLGSVSILLGCLKGRKVALEVKESQQLKRKHHHLAAFMGLSILAMACLCSPDCS